MILSRQTHAISLVGWALTFASVVFLAIVIRDRWSQVVATDLSGDQWLIVAGLAPAYGSSLFLLAGAWHALLRSVGARPVSAGRSIYAFTTTQLAKFVPGNVFHLLGRYLVHRSDGVTNPQLILASFLESILMVAGASLVVVAALILEPRRQLVGLIPWYGPYLLPAVLIAMAVGWMIWAKDARGGVGWLLTALSAYVFFFVLMGGIVTLLVLLLAPAAPLAVAGGGIAAWLVGFLTPGAPAGMGTREAAMLLFISDRSLSGALVVSVILFRLVTLAGDIFCFALGYLLLRKS